MDGIKYQDYVSILKKELVPAMGCTEPISIAYASALAKKYLLEEVMEVELSVSANIIKNVKSVVVPNTGGLKGIYASVSCGILFGDSDKVLEVISEVGDSSRGAIEEFIEKTKFTLEESKLNNNFDIHITLVGLEHKSEIRIVGKHTNVCIIKHDDNYILKKDFLNFKEETKVDRSFLNVKDIVEFADIVDINDVKEIIDRQIKYNMAIAEEGLKNNYGACIGQILITHKQDILTKVRAYAASGSDARMGGCELPVIINSGSGNQGITTSVPVIVYAKENNMEYEKLIRALVLSNLITMHLKTGIGSLSAYCGVICAGVGAASGICYLKGGKYSEISQTIINAIAIDSGVICDGAKASCAAKIASAIDSAILGMHMVEYGKEFCAGDGIVTEGVENTIKNIGRLASDGMKKTDEEIINIMIRSNC
jgi:L-cysteine desulfidase